MGQATKRAILSLTVTRAAGAGNPHSNFFFAKFYREYDPTVARAERSGRVIWTGGWVLLCCGMIMIPNPVSDWIFGCNFVDDAEFDRHLAKRKRENAYHPTQMWEMAESEETVNNRIKSFQEEMIEKKFKIVVLDPRNDPYTVKKKKKHQDPEYAKAINKSKKNNFQITKSDYGVKTSDVEMDLKTYYDMQVDLGKRAGVM
jgi:hypothetical protein